MDTAPLPVFVGESNPYGGQDRHALFPLPIGSAGHRLQTPIQLHRLPALQPLHRREVVDAGGAAPRAMADPRNLRRSS